VLEATSDPDAVIEQLRARGGDVTAALDGWLGLFGHQLTDGFDVSNPTLAECPAAVVASLRAALDPVPRPSIDEMLERVRERVPEEHRTQFDDLYDEARLVYRLRDERGIYSDVTAAGIMRRAMLAAGDRLVGLGRLDDRLLAVDATVEELTALLLGRPGPTSDELRARATYRETVDLALPPIHLGDEPAPPPPMEMLPPPARRAMAAVMTFMGHLFEPSMAEHGDKVVRGLGVGGGVHQGTARVVRTVDDLDRVGPGDVLVAMTTAESFNVALAMVSAVVTDNGGLLSHAAIMAREFGIPAVVGTREGTALIPDGATVVVDGDRGEITWR